MIAISSLRPKAKCTPDIWRNQVAAKQSWDQAFDHIFYVNHCEPELKSPKTSFIGVPGENGDFPKIVELMLWAAHQPTWAAIVNADILIRAPQFLAVSQELIRHGARSGLSWRFEFDPTTEVRTIQRVDLGLDIFCAIPEVWKAAHKAVPEMFRLGCCLWDTWTCGFLNRQGGAWDYSDSKCILHPRHGDRQSPQHIIDSTYRDKYTAAAGMPRNKLRLT